MNAHVPAARAVGSASVAVTALFDDPAVVNRALSRLNAAGVPRDLIEVVVSPGAAARFYGGAAQAPGRQALRHAGVGGLVGLVVGAAVSLILVAVPGLHDPGALAVVQLIGPNLATVGGAFLGGMIGYFVPRQPGREHARAAEAASSIVVVVQAGSEEEAAALADLLARSGGKEPRVER